MNKRAAFGGLVLVVCLSVGCQRSGAPAGPMKKAKAEKVASIVFIGKDQACACTKRRVESGWQALASALGQHSAVAVKRLAVDVDEIEVDTYQSQRRSVTLPALYFLNEKGELVGMLEGDVTPEQIGEMLK